MKIKNTALALILSLGSTYSIAGTEDWNGTFRVTAENEKTYTVTHTPRWVNFLFFTSKCLKFGKGVRINDLTIKEDISLCANLPIEKFTAEVQKLGVVIEKDVTVGPTYPS